LRIAIIAIGARQNSRVFLEYRDAK